MTPVQGDRRTSYPTQLKCVGCGLIYSRAAIARELTLSTEIACRRCGGSLEASHDPIFRRKTAVAVRSAIDGSIQAPRTP
jgi:uncharacterized paraquat-inducible protein A